MKKKVLGLALAAISLVATGAVAQNSATSTSNNNKSSAKVENLKTCKADKGGRKQINPFDGLNLTDTQKSQLQQLDSKRKADRHAQAQARKADKAKNDSVRRADRTAENKAYLDQVKAIVGPEQYVVFLENCFINEGAPRGGKAVMGQSKDKKNHAGRIQKNGRKDKKNHAFNRDNKREKGAGTKTATANAQS